MVIPELEKKREILQDIRIMHQPIDGEELRKREKKYMNAKKINYNKVHVDRIHREQNLIETNKMQYKSKLWKSVEKREFVEKEVKKFQI